MVIISVLATANHMLLDKLQSIGVLVSCYAGLVTCVKADFRFIALPCTVVICLVLAHLFSQIPGLSNLPSAMMNSEIAAFTVTFLVAWGCGQLLGFNRW